jgi:hypothetical protein
MDRCETIAFEFFPPKAMVARIRGAEALEIQL